MIPLGILASSVRRAASGALLAPTDLVATLVEPPPPLPAVIGEPYGGGFYGGDIQYPDGQWYKLIVADKSADVYALMWGGYGIDVATTETNGFLNTNLMVSSATSYPAAEHCAAFNGGGNSDWYMPSAEELGYLWVNLSPTSSGSPDNFRSGGTQAFHATRYYWCSTQESAEFARFRRFSDGNQNYGSKSAKTAQVRPIRRIPFTPD